jgi:hypothetical protein
MALDRSSGEDMEVCKPLTVSPFQGELEKIRLPGSPTFWPSRLRYLTPEAGGHK